MTNVYDQHRASFSNVEAHVILNSDGQKVATIAFKFPRDGASRLYAYVHWIGCEMVRGHAGGYGYDKRSSACASAVAKMQRIPAVDEYGNDWSKDSEGQGLLIAALAKDSGHTWDYQLRAAGFTVLQAV